MYKEDRTESAYRFICVARGKPSQPSHGSRNPLRPFCFLRREGRKSPSQTVATLAQNRAFRPGIDVAISLDMAREACQPPCSRWGLGELAADPRGRNASSVMGPRRRRPGAAGRSAVGHAMQIGISRKPINVCEHRYASSHDPRTPGEPEFHGSVGARPKSLGQASPRWLFEAVAFALRWATPPSTKSRVRPNAAALPCASPSRINSKRPFRIYTVTGSAGGAATLYPAHQA